MMNTAWGGGGVVRPMIVYSVANYRSRPHLSHFWANVIFVIPTFCDPGGSALLCKWLMFLNINHLHNSAELKSCDFKDGIQCELNV